MIKRGDIVRIRPLNYFISSSRYYCSPSMQEIEGPIEEKYVIIGDMISYLGEKAKVVERNPICDLGRNYYRLDIDGCNWCWMDSWLVKLSSISIDNGIFDLE